MTETKNRAVDDLTASVASAIIEKMRDGWVERGMLLKHWKKTHRKTQTGDGFGLFRQELAKLEDLGVITRVWRYPHHRIEVTDQDALCVLAGRCVAADRWCGTATGWRGGGRCPRCRDAHNTQTRDMRRGWSQIDQRTWHAVLLSLRNGRTLADAAARHGLTPAALFGQARVHLERREQLDAALMHGRDPDLPHGTARAVKAGCSCPECRESRRRWR